MVASPKQLHSMEEQISVKGELLLTIRDKDGNVISSEIHKNLVVNVGKQSLASLLGGAVGSADKRVSKVGFGTSGATTVGSTTTIENPFVKAIDGVTYSGTSALFAFALETTENNGVTIREFALFSNEDTMFSRLIRNPISKTADIRLSGVWKITF